jgi:hypothetical protein
VYVKHVPRMQAKASILKTFELYNKYVTLPKDPGVMDEHAWANCKVLCRQRRGAQGLCAQRPYTNKFVQAK